MVVGAQLWELQTDKGRLVLLKCPAKVSLPGPEELRDLLAAWKHHMPDDVQADFHGFEQREPLFETKIHMCTQGLRDPDSGKWLKRSSRMEVNDPFWCSLLGAQATCDHGPGAHQVVEGSLSSGEARMDFVMRWTSSWASKVLDLASRTLKSRKERAGNTPLHAPSSPEREWEVIPVEVETSPEGLLRQRLGEVTGHRYDYIYFEGASGALSKQLRSTLAKLHVVLGHVSAEKLKRMLHLNGAKDHILNAVNDLRCQICQAVTAPTPSPKAAFDRPQRFNERILVDNFFI